MQSLADIGAAIRAARRARRLSVVALSAAAGVNRNTIGALENGRGNVELNTLLALCAVLDLELALVPRAVAPAAREDGNTRPTALQRDLDALRGPRGGA